MKGGGGGFSRPSIPIERLEDQVFIEELISLNSYLLYPTNRVKSYIPTPKTYISPEDIYKYITTTKEKITKLTAEKKQEKHRKWELEEEINSLIKNRNRIVPIYEVINDKLCFVDNTPITNHVGNTPITNSVNNITYAKVIRYNGEPLTCKRKFRSPEDKEDIGNIWEDYQIFSTQLDIYGNILPGKIRDLNSVAGGRRKQTRKHKNKCKRKKTRCNKNRK